MPFTPSVEKDKCRTLIYAPRNTESDKVMETLCKLYGLEYGVDVVGYGNSITNNYIYNNDNNIKENTNSWFSERFKVLCSLLNDARKFYEKEYTVEYISALIGLKNVDGLKVYLAQEKEPDDEFKKKFVEVFGVNEEWMVYGRGEHPFASNISFYGNNPMDILRREDLKNLFM